MARSLEIDKENISIGIEGTQNSPIKIKVTVDGENTNSSFTVSAFNDYWFTYSIERSESNVYIVVNIKKNLTTQERYGSITIKHNCANISKTIDISQKAVEYEIKNKTTHYHSFKSVPKDSNGDLCRYEEFKVELDASYGRSKWYVKDIKQYQVSQNDSFDDSTYVDKISQDNSMIQTQTSYDGAFNYSIDGNYLVVRSYGQIDLTNSIKVLNDGKPHMRYFFIISHSDVNNSNKIPMDEKDAYKNQTKRYEDKILFVFDGKTGSGYAEDDNPAIDPVTPPSEITTYVFLINGSSSEQTFNFGSDPSENTLSVTSTKLSSDGVSEIGYNVENNLKWCSINNGKLIVTKNEGNDSRQGTITFKQNESNKEITLLVAQDGTVKTYTFTLNGTTENREIDIDDASSFTIVSTYGGNATPFTITNISSTKWITYTENNNSYTFTAEENTSYDSRYANFVFKQTNSGKTIYLTLTQKGKAETNEFNAYFKESGNPKSKTIEYGISTLSVELISTKNGVFEPYEYKVEYYNSANNTWVTEDSWMMYSDTSKQISVDEYDYDDVRNNNDGAGNNYSTTARITFTRDGMENQVLTLTQKREEIEIVFSAEDILTVGYEGKYYSEPYGIVYSYKISNGVKSPVNIVKTEVVSGDFILSDKVQLSTIKEDGNGYYYKVTVEVTKNELEEIRNGIIRFTNSYGQTCDLTVEQRKNGEIVLTAFDYIVMNYYWDDYVTVDGAVKSRDFDCVMYFDTEAIGNMYQKCAYYGVNLITDTNSEGNRVTYGELAYDQVSSSTGNINRIETQVVYMLNLKDDGYLQKIKEASERYLTIQLYGNLFNKTNATETPEQYRNTKLSIHTYLGGTMLKDDDNQTMVNTGGTEVNVGAIKDVTYNITAINSTGGNTVEKVTTKFQHLGTLQYNVKDKTAVFIPVNN